MKTPLSFLLYPLLTLTLLGLTGCGQPTPAAAIEKVLNRCADISGSLNRSQLSAADAAYAFANAAQQIDTRDCPAEFRLAYQAHVNAWRRAASTLPTDMLMSAFLEGFIGGASGDYSMVGQTYRDAAMALAVVDETYYQLVEIAAAYGARIPHSEVDLN